MPRPAATPVPTEASIRPRTSVASASRSPAVGGSLEMWRSLWRTTPAWGGAGEGALGVADDAGLEGVVEGDLGALPDHQLGRAAADVDDQGRLARRRLGG